jgi:nucleotide sugar dehydrogenase
MSLEETRGRIKRKEGIIEIFGIGYIGFPLSVRLASSGFRVVSVDTDENRLKELKFNELKPSENSLKELFINLKNKKQISFSKYSLKSNLPKIGIICVPTPIDKKQSNSNVFVIDALENFLANSKKGDVIIVESSLEIGSFDDIKKIIEEKGFSIGKDFGLAYCPERIDPLNKKWELHNIPRIIYCEEDNTFEIAKLIYENVNQANLVRVSTSKTAELVKSFENTFRLVNISLVNELAILCNMLEVSVSEVLSAASTKPFGFIPFYSGAGAGGHCIPKDSIFLYNSAKKFDFDFSIVRKALEINKLIPKYIVESVERILLEKNLPKRVLVVGLTYKENLEDMRDSPGLKIVKEFLKNSIEVKIFDPFFNPNSLKDIFNHKMNFNNLKTVKNLNTSNIKDVSCMIIVQHHNKMKKIIQKIYDSSSVPVIYDCQSKLLVNENSSTSLKFFG